MVAQRILHLGSPASSFPLIEAMSYSGPATTLSLSLSLSTTLPMQLFFMASTALSSQTVNVLVTGKDFYALVEFFILFMLIL